MNTTGVGAAEAAPTPSLSITTSGIATSTQGASYTASLVTSGSVGIVRWALVSGSLPVGLGLASDGTISGVPTGTTSTFTVKATDSSSPVAQTATRTLTLKVVAALKLLITAPTSLSATQGKPVSVSLTASGGVSPYEWSVSNGTLPAGLSLSPGGQFSGIPTGSGTSTVSIQVTDSLGSTPQTASAQFTISVQPADPLTVTSTTLPTATVATSYGTSLMAHGGVGPDTWSLQAGSLPSGLTLDADGLISGQASQAGSTAFTVAVNDSSTPIPQSTTQALTLTVGAAGAVSITPDLPTGTQGSHYYGSLTATGGTGPYVWSVQGGQLPPGLTLGSNGGLTGTPTGHGSYNVTFQVADSMVPSNVVSAPESIVVQAAPPVTINSPYLPVGTQGSNYDAYLTASGGVGPYSWTLGTGALPSGMTLSSLGQIYGTPTDSGAFNVTVVATDSATPMPNVASVPLTLTIAAAAPLAITTTSLGSGTQGAYYDVTLQSSGGVGYDTWSLASGTLPAGMYLDSYGDLYGTPTSAGTSTFTVQVTDQATPTPNVASVPLTLTIAAAAPLAITTTSLDSGVQGTDYYASLQANGGVGYDTWSLASGTLPAGMYLDSYGELYGTPSALGTYNFTVQVTDQATPTPNVASVPLTLTIAAPAPLAITTTSLDPGAQDAYYDVTLQSSGGVNYDTWSLASGTLPAGMYLDSYGDLYGTPTSAGTSTFTVQVTDQATPTPNVASVPLTLTIAAAAPLAITTTSLDPGAQGAYYDVTLQSSGGVNYDTWSLASGTLPAGMYLDSYGDLYGTPTSAGTSTFTVQVTDQATPTPNVASVPLTLTIAAAAPLAITTTSLDPGAQGAYYDVTLQSSGGVNYDTWSLASGTLPAGMYLDSYGDLYGTPTWPAPPPSRSRSPTRQPRLRTWPRFRSP